MIIFNHTRKKKEKRNREDVALLRHLRLRALCKKHNKELSNKRKNGHEKDSDSCCVHLSMLMWDWSLRLFKSKGALLNGEFKQNLNTRFQMCST